MSTQKFYNKSFYDRDGAITGFAGVLDDCAQYVEKNDIVIGINLISHRNYPVGYSIVCYNGMYVVNDAVKTYERDSWDECRQILVSLYLDEIEAAFRGAK